MTIHYTLKKLGLSKRLVQGREFLFVLVLHCPLTICIDFGRG